MNKMGPSTEPCRSGTAYHTISLPLSHFLSTFRRHLKTYLFRCCYNTVWYCSYLLCL